MSRHTLVRSTLTSLPAVLAISLTVAFVLAAFPEPALADILSQTESRLTNVYRSLKRWIYIIGGIGLVVLAGFAFFGRFKWPHFLSLAGGLFLVAMAAELVTFLGGDASLVR